MSQASLVPFTQIRFDPTYKTQAFFLFFSFVLRELLVQQSIIITIDYLTFEVNYRLLKIKSVANCRKISQQQMILTFSYSLLTCYPRGNCCTRSLSVIGCY